MARGYIGKMLFADLSDRKAEVEDLDESICEQFIGGYGIGARIMYSRQKPGVDPLGPDNMLGFVTSPLTGSMAVATSRFGVMAKSPLTGGWGDANSGGVFGPYLKFAGLDGLFVNGIADTPTYIVIKDGKAEFKDASHLWGMDTFETETMLQEEYGKDASAACIGVASEKLSLISGIITKSGSAAARSGLGAVMGSKKLKAIVVVPGEKTLPVYDADAVKALRKEYIADIKKVELLNMDYFKLFHKYGTAGAVTMLIERGSTPIKNWSGATATDFPDFMGLHRDKTIANQAKNEGCWRCVIACKGMMKEGQAPYKYKPGTRRPEYESIGALGPLCLNSNIESVIMANDICNRNGLDTISAGATIAFAIECYENGLITKKDTDGIELTWGNDQAIVEMTDKLSKREGFGDVLADGVKAAAERIGKGSEEFAIHCGGQELGMHDPKVPHPLGDRVGAARYWMDATPGRHNQGFGPSGFEVHLTNAACYCVQGGYWLMPGKKNKYFTGFLKNVTGWDRSIDELHHISERIANIRHCFNLREGINPIKDWKLHPRVIGDPPLKDGPLKDVTVDLKAMLYWNLGALDWDRVTAKPSKKKLLSLGLEDVATDMWPDTPKPGGPHG